MKHILLLLSLFLISITGCDVLKSSDEYSSHLFGAWYNVENLDNSSPGPDQRIFGWNFTKETQAAESSIGTISPLGINGKTGELSLIDSQFLPSYQPQIHSIESDFFVVDYFGYTQIASIINANSNNSQHAVSDYYLTKDTVKYNITLNQLTLQGTYYQGTFKRAGLGEKVVDPVVSEFVVSIDGQEIENLKIAESVPSAYISRISEGNIHVHSKLGGKNITIKIPDFRGPGSYTIDKHQAVYSMFGFDTISPSYVTPTDSAGVITIDQFDLDNNRATGEFHFTVQMGDNETDPEFVKSFTNGSFDLAIF